MPEQQLSFTTMGGETVTVRKRGKHYVQPRGYFYHPGTGPAGETCGGCEFAARYGRYTKCEKNRARWSHTRRSDILTSAPACKYWEAAKP
jgi:hypothetical protein